MWGFIVFSIVFALLLRFPNFIEEYMIPNFWLYFINYLVKDKNSHVKKMNGGMYSKGLRYETKVQTEICREFTFT